MGSKWNGDYLVADLEDFKQNAKRPSVHQVKRVYCAPKERFLFPIRTVYDKRTRSICLDDPAMNDSGSSSAKHAKQSDQFDFDEGWEASFNPADVPEPPEEVVTSHGANVDYWERDEAAHKWTYFVVVPRKAMVVPHKTPGALGIAPEVGRLSPVRISRVNYEGKPPVAICEEIWALGKTRLMQHWTGHVEFFDSNCAPPKPPKAKYASYQKHGILGHHSSLPYEQEVERSQRAYAGSRKPNTLDSETWRSMNSYEREGYVEAELREAEAKAMSRHDSRDAASAVKIEYDDGYESPVIPKDNDRWVLDAKLGILTRIYVKSRRAKFEPSSVKDCPVSIDQIMDARVTVVETEGAEFVVHDSWRKPTHSAMPFRWSGKTVFVLRQSMGVEVKVRPVETGALPPSEIPDKAYGYGLKAKSSLSIAPGCSALVDTGMSFKKPEGVWARVGQAPKGAGREHRLTVCPGSIEDDEKGSSFQVRVSNPTDSDITIDEGCVVAVASFDSSVICPATFSVEENQKGNESDSADMFAAPTQSVMHSDIPEMPLRSTPYINRSHDQTVRCYSACVARPVDRKERVANPKAKAALDKEWNKLITRGCLDYATVREWSDVSAEARKTGAVAHVGRIFDICVEKYRGLRALCTFVNGTGRCS